MKILSRAILVFLVLASSAANAADIHIPSGTYSCRIGAGMGSAFSNPLTLDVDASGRLTLKWTQTGEVSPIAHINYMDGPEDNPGVDNQIFFMLDYDPNPPQAFSPNEHQQLHCRGVPSGA